MRIVIDMQGAQTASRYRGIGRYTMGFTHGVLRNCGEHEVILVLSCLFPETIEPIRAAFIGLISKENIRVWHAPGPVYEGGDNDERREIAELIREKFIYDLKPDVIHVTSLFEGFVDDAVTSIGRLDHNIPVSTVLFDLIPLLNPKQYLDSNPSYSRYYLRKVEHLKKSSSLLSISEFTRIEGLQTLNLSDDGVVNISTAIESSFKPVDVSEDDAKALYEKLGITKKFILYTGGADERKNLPRLLEAYSRLPFNLNNQYQLVLAGKIVAGELSQLETHMKALQLTQNEVCFTGYITDEELIQLYNLCALYVFPSWHEGFGLPALEAMACGAPVIGAGTSSLPEVIGLNDALFDPMNITSIKNKMAEALQSPELRKTLIENGLQRAQYFSWDKTALLAINAWCDLTKKGHSPKPLSKNEFLESLASQVSKVDDEQLKSIATCLALNEKETQIQAKRQLFVDISELVKHDAKSGIQRVVRNILKQWLENEPERYDVQPVYADEKLHYRYARRFTKSFLGFPVEQNLKDDFIEFAAGDLFLGLDFQPQIIPAQRQYYQFLRRQGVQVKFVVYDLLCVLMPQYFVSGSDENFSRWLDVVTESDGAICISKTVANELQGWVNNNAKPRQLPYQIDWFHLGADIDEQRAIESIPEKIEQTINRISEKTSFLLVGTIEPRKGHEQVLKAFEILWEQGKALNLVIVGKQGWLTEELISKLHEHEQLNNNLFWLSGISDLALDKVYDACDCLIAASYGEGFGLPIIEAAQHDLPIIARDIPVFREVAGDNAFYFDVNSEPKIIASQVMQWEALFLQNNYPMPNQISWLTWSESAEQLLKITLA